MSVNIERKIVIEDESEALNEMENLIKRFAGNFAFLTIWVNVFVDDDASSGLSNKHRWNKNVGIVSRWHYLELIRVLVIDDYSVKARILSVSNFVWKFKKMFVITKWIQWNFIVYSPANEQDPLTISATNFGVIPWKEKLAFGASSIGKQASAGSAPTARTLKPFGDNDGPKRAASDWNSSIIYEHFFMIKNFDDLGWIFLIKRTLTWLVDCVYTRTSQLHLPTRVRTKTMDTKQLTRCIFFGKDERFRVDSASLSEFSDETLLFTRVKICWKKAKTD